MLWLLLGCPGQPDLPVKGELAPCWSSPNCVTSQTDPRDEVHYVLPMEFHGEPEAAVERMRQVLEHLPGAGGVFVEGMHLRVAVKTESGLFTDDVDVLFDTERRLVHVRSSSRIGYGDFGLNRQRTEQLRAMWMQVSAP